MIDSLHITIDGTFCASFILITVGGTLRGSSFQCDVLTFTHYLHFTKVKEVVVTGIGINDANFLSLNSICLMNKETLLRTLFNQLFAIQ